MLAAAVACGVSGTVFTRASRGFTRWAPGLAGACSYAGATVLMAWLLDRLPVGVVYAAWSGAAAVTLLAIDVLVLKMRTTPVALGGMAVTLAGVALLGTAMT